MPAADNKSAKLLLLRRKERIESSHPPGGSTVGREDSCGCHGGCLVGSLDHPSTESFHVFTAHWAHSLAAIRRYEEDSECLEFNPAAALGTLMDHFERMLSGT